MKETLKSMNAQGELADLKMALKSYLDEKWQAVLARYSFLADGGWKTTKNIVLFGLGGRYKLGRAFLEAQGYRVSALCDNDAKKWGQVIGGLTVISPDSLKKMDDVFVFVMTLAPKNIEDVKTQLSDLAVDCLPFSEYVLLSNRDKVNEVCALFQDKKSVSSYFEMMRMSVDSAGTCGEDVFDPDIYLSLPEFQHGDKHEIYLDIGAHVGTDTERFIWARSGLFGKIYCFEPSARPFKALRARATRLTEEFALDSGAIECVQAGVWEKSGILKFEVPGKDYGSGSFCAFETGADTPVVSLDEFLQGTRPTFLKADVEGAELAMLKGAQKTIAGHRPKIAVSMYHSPQDYFELPLFIKALNPEYSFAARQHSRSQSEAVLYCFMPH